MIWLTELALAGFVVSVIGHITGSMGFDTLGYGLAMLVVVRLVWQVRPAPPTSGLGFVLLSVGGLGGWFGIEEFAVPGSWPMVFKAFAGICLGALTILIWQFFARQPEQPAQPLQPTTQNMLIVGLLLLLLTPLARQSDGLLGGQTAATWAIGLQQVGVVLAVVGFSLARQRGRGWRWLALLLPPLLAVPLVTKLLLVARKPLMMAMWVLAPSFGGSNVGFTPLQYLDHQAFLKPSSKVVMRVRAEQLPSPYLVGNRVDRFNSRSMSWEAAKTNADQPAQAEHIGDADHNRSRFLLSGNHNGDFTPENWSMTVTSLRWDPLIFLPPQAAEVLIETDSLALNIHKVWSADFAEDASKNWVAFPGKSKPESVSRVHLQLPDFWDIDLQRQA